MKQEIPQEAQETFLSAMSTLAGAVSISTPRVCDHCRNPDEEAFPFGAIDRCGMRWDDLCNGCYESLGCDHSGKVAYLTGYTGKPTRSPQQLLQLAINLDAMVIDCRFNPASRWVRHWNRNELAKVLGERYLWVRSFANNAYKEGRIELVDPAAGLAILSCQPAQSVIILCACSDGERCHRKQVGEYLADAGWQVREVTKEEWSAAHAG